MARTALVITRVSRNRAVAPTLTNSDGANDHSFVNNGYIFFIATNGAGTPAAQIISVADPRFGRTVDGAISPADGTTNRQLSLMGPFHTDAWNQAGLGIVHVDCAVSGSAFKFGAIEFLPDGEH